MPTGFLRSSIDRTQRKHQPFSERSIFTVSAPEILLSSMQREKVINDIKQIVNAPEAIFDNLYRTLINNFVRYAQILPVNNEARMGSIMDEGLLRGLFALQVLQRESSKEPEPLICYVVFSASMLFDVGFMTGNRLVNIVDKQGTFIGNWMPYLGPMVANSHYKIRRGGGMPPWLCRRVAVLFARQILPEIGFNWIAGDAYAFNMWIALLNNEHAGVESLKLYIDRALEMLDEYKASQEVFWPVEVEIKEAKEVSLAEDFMEWLEKIIAEEKVTVNQADSKIHVLAEGLYIKLPEMLEDFSKQHARNPNAHEVLEQLKKLGFLKLVDGEVKIERFYYGQAKGAAATGIAFGTGSVASRVSLFRDMGVGGAGIAGIGATVANADVKTAATQVAQKEIGAEAGPVAKELPSEAIDRVVSSFGMQTGVIFDGPNASCLVGRINVNFSLPDNNMFRVDTTPVVEQAPTSLAQDINNYPSAAAKFGAAQEYSTSATKVFATPSYGSETPQK